MTDNIALRTYIIVDRMQPQYSSITGTVVKGDVCLPGMSQLYIEVEPGSEVYRMLDIAVKSTNAKPGFQIVEREYGEIELHSHSIEEVTQAGEAILEEYGLRISDRIKPRIISEQVITNVDALQAQLINRDNRLGSILVPGETVYVCEVEPAAYISIIVNEAEKNSDIKIINFDPVGRYGRMYVSGTESNIRTVKEVVKSVLDRIEGRD